MDFGKGASHVSFPNRPTSSTAGERAEQLATLVYELLDAHADTAQLVGGPSTELLWRAHLQYLRDLQRTGHEILARGASA